MHDYYYMYMQCIYIVYDRPWHAFYRNDCIHLFIYRTYDLFVNLLRTVTRVFTYTFRLPFILIRKRSSQIHFFLLLPYLHDSYCSIVDYSHTSFFRNAIQLQKYNLNSKEGKNTPFDAICYMNYIYNMSTCLCKYMTNLA